MTAALTPELALSYLAELSADVRDAVVLDSAGELLAGRSALADAARGLLDATEAREVEVATQQGSVFAARSDEHAVVVAAGRLALPALMLFDLRAILGDLAAAGNSQ